jgi:hypothetical protein
MLASTPNTSTVDFFNDNSTMALYRFNNNYEDEARIYRANPNNSSFTSTNKFGNASVNCQNNGVFVDLPVNSRYYAVSGWHYKTQTGTDGYVYDFRLNNPSNGRGYLYAATQNFSLSTDTTASSNTGDIYFNGVRLTGSYNIPLNQWVHIVVSVNNPSVAQQNWTAGGLRLGNRSDGTSGGQSGFFDQVRIFNRPLTQDEVRRLYNERPGPV